ncbi:MAG: nucleotidyltransferase domain-containing protein [Nitrospinae bacterium]|nr:nucleotidyltransferase domain-containing protein [Nitrospinota bacterium]MBF0633979.1 nucleotidyltransferase domain-containing protein [Nitrospinota bacterium]
MGKADILVILRDYKQNNAEKYGILEIGVFGSIARDEARDDSDVDICVKTKTPDAFALVHIKEEIENLVGKHVDIIRVREQMNPFLKKRIEKEGVYV